MACFATSSGLCCNAADPEDLPGEARKPLKRNFQEHKMGVKGQDAADLNQEEQAAWHRPHRCTDVGALLLFLAGLACMGWVLNYARIHGDLRRLYHGINFHGQLCGVDAKVVDAPFLFWCSKPAGLLPKDLAQIVQPSSTLDLKHPICVEACPTNNEAHHSCFQSMETKHVSKDPITGTLVENVTYTFRLVQDYETQPLGGHYCMPKDTSMLIQLGQSLQGHYQAGMFRVREVLDCWLALICSSVIAILLGYLYLFLVGRLVEKVVYTFLALAVALPLLAGAALLYGALRESSSQELLEEYGWHPTKVPSTGDRRLDLAAASACLALGALVGIAACCLRHSLELIIGSIEAATEALRDLPTLLIAPLVSVLLKVAVVLLEFAGLAWVLSVGKVRQFRVASEDVPGGIARSFDLEQDHVIYIAVYAVVALWIVEMLFALEQFVLAYSVQLWYFKDYHNGRKGFIAFPMVRGLCVAIKYHLGTLALGSFLLTLLEAIHFVLSMVYKRVQEAEEEAGKCSVAKVLAGCCCCCMSFFECFVRFINKNAYIITAVESKPFCSAAQTAFSIVANEISAIGMLTAVLKFFMLVGFISITSIGAYSTWFLVNTVEYFKDPQSPHYVSSPEWVTGAAAVISAVVAGTFMAMFDSVADTILFCWALDRKYREDEGLPAGNNAPPCLQDLLESESTEKLFAQSSARY